LKFGIDSILLWSKTSQLREVRFQRNAVNVITGESHTGKTAILDIVDYCFLASEHKLPESVINENISWYGVKFYANEKTFALCRRAPTGGVVSDDYFFSSTGAIPQRPNANTAKDDLRNILEAEFGIDERVTVAYGGRALKAGSKISFRYFFLFNTVSEDIITNREVFFDRQSEDRYREALPRIFDIALGIDDLNNINAREERDRLSREVSRLERKDAHLAERRDTFKEEAHLLAAQAAEFGVIPAATHDVTIDGLREAFASAAAKPVDGAAEKDRYSDVSSKLFLVTRRRRQLDLFQQEYSAYKQSLEKSKDSLRPLEVLLNRSPELMKAESFTELISAFTTDLQRIKESIAAKHPVDGQISSLLKDLDEERTTLEAELSSLPKAPKSFESLRQKWLFIGEAKGKLDAYTEAPAIASRESGDSNLATMRTRLDSIQVRDVQETRDAVLSLINEIALGMLSEVGEVMANYAHYQPIFNYKEKRLQLRKPRSQLVENVGSSSNHMFLHLLHFLALHEVAISQDSRFIPSFLILDQPSRPYYGEARSAELKTISHSDTAKISAAFQLLDQFIARMNRDYKSEFQMIVFEHVPTDIFDRMEHVHLSEEFRNGNALIPQDWVVPSQ
jgi:hypothetical protein